ncbi:hypothetical protein K469DRAFT_688202 [Zopfia rhizophila CBS 207.26]|uniref:BCS1 N-terminal domain-containing protein n=1 Tax=Zopfia rhizophila CBS 207.26 TaxID=1314779 RepID=A0A6A6E2N0_9PEZI|nr:hypothetical protein K469DRAFT_688202 [Zopfia rhizophila CBS 207.26]
MDGQLYLTSFSDSAGLMHLATRIIESFVPGYGYIARYLLQNQCRIISLDYFMSLIHFNDSDEMFTTILNWIAEQDFAKSVIRLKASSKESRQEQVEECKEDGGFDASELFHARKWSAKSPPPYELFFGTYRF